MDPILINQLIQFSDTTKNSEPHPAESPLQWSSDDPQGFDMTETQ